MPSHYLGQCWLIVNQTLGNRFQWILNQNIIFIEENAHDIAIYKNVSHFSMPEYVNMFLYHTMALSPSQSPLYPPYAYRGLWGPARSHAIGISGPLIYHSCATPIWASREGCIMEGYHSHGLPMNNHMCSKEGHNLWINTLRPELNFWKFLSTSAFSWNKMFVFWLKIHWNLFVRVHLTNCHHWFR